MAAIVKRYIVPATAYFPPDMHRSIIGADELNDCVRDGNRCDLIARITETIYLFCNDLINYFMTALVAGESQKMIPTKAATMQSIITNRTRGEAIKRDIRFCIVAQSTSSRKSDHHSSWHRAAWRWWFWSRYTRFPTLNIRTRLISTARLHALLHFDLPPIDQVISLESDNEISS